MSISPSQFGYPRALYDPNYVPPKILHRNNELKSLMNIFHSSLNPEDNFNVNAYIYGIRGIGKTVFTKYFIELLKSQTKEIFIPIYLNTAIKSPLENLRLVVELYSQSIGNDFAYFNTSQELWSYFHFLRNKSNLPLILIFDNVNPLNQPLYEKFIRYSKDLRISTIATSQIPYKLRTKESKIIAESLDFPLKLEIYSSSALFDILSQRISIAFPIELEPHLLEYIVDIVTQFDYFRPSTCITVLKSIFQHLIHGNDITPTLIRESCIPLLEFPYQGDLHHLLQLDDSTIELLYLPLLEKIAVYFKNRKNIYITQNELDTLYRITCEELISPYEPEQCRKFIEKLIFDGFLYPSQFNFNEVNRYFIIINPNRLLEYLEIKFLQPSD